VSELQENRMPKWGMVIDLDKCTGCQACTIACKAENNVPHGSPEEQSRKREIYWNKGHRCDQWKVSPCPNDADPHALHAL